MRQRFDAILFDCDGVLVDSEPTTCGVLGTMLRELGADISTDETMRRFIGKSVREEVQAIEALIHAVEVATIIGVSDIVLLGDSAVVVGQASGVAKCRSHELRAHLEKFQTLARTFERIRIRRISRTQNLAGIALARTRL